MAPALRRTSAWWDEPSRRGWAQRGPNVRERRGHFWFRRAVGRIASEARRSQLWVGPRLSPGLIRPELGRPKPTLRCAGGHAGSSIATPALRCSSLFRPESRIQCGRRISPYHSLRPSQRECPPQPGTHSRATAYPRVQPCRHREPPCQFVQHHQNSLRTSTYRERFARRLSRVMATEFDTPVWPTLIV